MIGKYMELFDNCVYSFHSKNNILEEKDIGICSDIASILTPESSVAAMNCFQGCPFSNTGFYFDVRVDGEKVKSKIWKWLPNAIYRQGCTDAFQMDTLTAVVPGKRTVVQKIVLINKTDKEIVAPLQVMYRGRTRKEENWEFLIPCEEKSLLSDYSAQDRMLSAVADGLAFRLTSSLKNMYFFQTAYLWENEVIIPPNKKLEIYFSAHIGTDEKSLVEALETLDNYETSIDKSFEWLLKEVSRIHDKLPRFSSSVKELDALYYRSLVTYILCRWENPDLCIVPYFSNGGINGGCMGSYLWGHSGGVMMHPLYDAEGNKKEIKLYLQNDITRTFAINPLTGKSWGPWYQINQEKIIQMVYYHVLFTGDWMFLLEKVGEKTVLEWMKYHAYVCDDVSKDVELYDFGDRGEKGGNHHLELRRGIPYNGIMPDLNARRYQNYMKAYELSVLVGQPDERLVVRAQQLKEKLKTLWNENENWYDFISAEKRDTRYTVQMYKFLNSPVIGEKERQGLISHLNEKEFLSKFGLHSMSKLDIAYDQDDIDNGGGGICNPFTTQICAQLYETGYDELATNILQRIYWWGTRMPYMGDSCAANMIMNREDTPLQGDIGSISCAQTIFFYIFGIKVDFGGNISISPVKVRPADIMKVENARLCGKVFDVSIQGDHFDVTYGGKTYTARIGEKIKI